MLNGFEEMTEVVRVATRVALCNRLEHFLEGAALARKDIQEFDRATLPTEEMDMFEPPDAG